MIRTTSAGEAYHADDVVVWADGFWARLGEVHSGCFTHRSDDFEIVRTENDERLKELGLAEELGLCWP